jgi:4-amino-4-deoxy-L-arabinose transferase-like glycosyltransferase
MPLRDRAEAALSGPPSSRGRRDGALLVIVFTALLVLPPVGHHLVVKSDEARFVLLARDMLRRGAWFTAAVEGQQYRNKPPLFPWIIASLSRLQGEVTEGTAQLPVAVAAIGAALATFLLGDRLFGRRAGIWTALILATSVSFFIHSQQVLPDMLVLAFSVTSLYAFWRAVSEPPSALPMVAFYGAVALAVFAKGPAGLLPLLIVAVWLWSERGARGLLGLWSAAGAAVFAAITLAWLGPFLASGSQSFGESVVWEDWLAWYLALPAPRRIGAFLLDALIGFLPWTIVLPMALGHVARTRRDPAVRFALLSFVVPLVVVVFSRARLVRYLLPIYPGAALLVGWWADTAGARSTRLARMLGWASFVAVVAAALLVPMLLAIAPPAIPDGDGILSDPALVRKTLLPLACALLLGMVFLLGLRDARPRLLVLGGAGLTAILLGYGAWVVNGWTERTEDFRALAVTLHRHAPDGDVKVFTQAKLLPLDFYAGREVPRISTVDELRAYLAGDPHATVLIDQQDLRVTPPDLTQDLRVLETLRIHEQSLYVLGCGASERATGSPRCATSQPLRR